MILINKVDLKKTRDGLLNLIDDHNNVIVFIFKNENGSYSVFWGPRVNFLRSN